MRTQVRAGKAGAERASRLLLETIHELVPRVVAELGQSPDRVAQVCGGELVQQWDSPGGAGVYQELAAVGEDGAAAKEHGHVLRNGQVIQ